MIRLFRVLGLRLLLLAWDAVEADVSLDRLYRHVEARANEGDGIAQRIVEAIRRWEPESFQVTNGDIDQLLTAIEAKGFADGDLIDTVASMLSVSYSRLHLAGDVLEHLRKALLNAEELQAAKKAFAEELVCSECGQALAGSELVTIFPQTGGKTQVFCAVCRTPEVLRRSEGLTQVSSELAKQIGGEEPDSLSKLFKARPIPIPVGAAGDPIPPPAWRDDPVAPPAAAAAPQQDAIQDLVRHMRRIGRRNR